MAKQLVVTNGQLVSTSHINLIKMVDITPDNAMTATTFHSRKVLAGDNTPLKVRRNGKTQVWKTRPDQYRIPVKYGLYQYFNITQENAHEWYIPQQ